jgi:hypothetical protein
VSVSEGLLNVAVTKTASAVIGLGVIVAYVAMPLFILFPCAEIDRQVAGRV